MKKLLIFLLILKSISCFSQEKEYYRFSYNYFINEVKNNTDNRWFYLKIDSKWTAVSPSNVSQFEINDATDWKISEKGKKDLGVFSEGGVYKVSDDVDYGINKSKWLQQYYQPIWEIRIRELNLNIFYSQEVSTKVNSDKIFDIPENSAEFPGGEAKLNEFIGQSIKANVWHKYPKGAKVFVQFIISKEGKVNEIEIIKGLNQNINKQVIVALSQMPNWIPARQKGKVVASRLILPIQLEQNNKTN